MVKRQLNWFEALVRAKQTRKPCLVQGSERSQAFQRPIKSAQVAPQKKPDQSQWPVEHCASEPTPFFYFVRAMFDGQCSILLALGVLFGSLLQASSAVREIDAVGLTVNDLEKEMSFFTQVLPFELVSQGKFDTEAAIDLFGLQKDHGRAVRLKLGTELITLTEHAVKGQPAPADSRSYDHWFQHIAIVVSDMDRAYAHLRKNKVKQVSTGPQTLPEWNPNAGGIKAFYFRDPEDHVLEIIWFPPGKGDPKWQAATDKLFLGIDHTAIVVSDTDHSLAFYRDLLGLRVAGESENYGVEQERLNQVFGARLRITGLRAEHGPGIEFLEYITPPGGRPAPSTSQANDLIFWLTDLRVDHGLEQFSAKLKHSAVRFVSRGVVTVSGNASEPGKTVIVRDPDGHGLELTESNSTVAASAKP
jgi:catechol 2,3-dioxygenase-like lactoylglutathione lyase family enzyme